MTDAEFFRQCDDLERRCEATMERARAMLAAAEALLIDVRARRAVARLVAEIEDEAES